VFGKQEPNEQKEAHSKTQADLFREEFYEPKESFLPAKRDLYKNLYYGNLDRHSQKDLYADPKSLQITVPKPDLKVNFPELYVIYEFKAYLRIKHQFFNWFEDKVRTTIRKNMRVLKKGQEEGKGGDRSGQQQDVNMEEAPEELKDDVIMNPQMKLCCVLCGNKGERRVTGRLIPFNVSSFVHINCALWSNEVFETEEGQLTNLYLILGKTRNNKCQVCQKGWASIQCFQKKCNQYFHFPCALQANVSFMKNKEVYCEGCAKVKGLAPGYPTEFNTRRRVYLVKNQQMWQPFSDIRQCPIERWRPYYYDLFNRVGNLTILSLGERVNEIIEDMEKARVNL